MEVVESLLADSSLEMSQGDELSMDVVNVSVGHPRIHLSQRPPVGCLTKGNSSIRWVFGRDSTLFVIRSSTQRPFPPIRFFSLCQNQVLLSLYPQLSEPFYRSAIINYNGNLMHYKIVFFKV